MTSDDLTGPASGAPDERERIAEAFDIDRDPLAAYAATFAGLDIDPFAVAIGELFDEDHYAEATIKGYERVAEQWTTHIQAQGRHPACPHEGHVQAFVTHCRDDRGNSPRTITEKLRKLEQLYRFWQADPNFPHGQGFNPFRVVKERRSAQRQSRSYPPISLAEIRDRVQGITHVRDRLLVVVQLKLGLRASEVCNLRLADLQLTDDRLMDHYPTLGDHRSIEGRPNAVYVAHDRARNKSRRPRVLPLDEELQELLAAYLYVRPDNDAPWVFLSKNGHAQLRRKDLNRVWKAAFHPTFDGSDEHAPVTSHYGRHRFTTYWRVTQGLHVELVKYMRGDTPGSADLKGQAAILNYLHTYYEDIESVYRDGIFSLNG